VLGEATLLLAMVDVGRRPLTLTLLVAVIYLGNYHADLVSNSPASTHGAPRMRVTMNRAPTMFLTWAIFVVPIQLLDDETGLLMELLCHPVYI
jgi:hypothetical protein